MCLLSDPKFEWPEGALFELDFKKCQDQIVDNVRVAPGPLFMSGLRSLAKHWCKSLSYVAEYL